MPFSENRLPLFRGMRRTLDAARIPGGIDAALPKDTHASPRNWSMRSTAALNVPAMDGADRKIILSI